MSCAFQVSRQHLDEKGVPLDGARITCYENGTTIEKNTYCDAGLTVLNPNPVILNSRGSCKIYWDGTPVRFELWYNGELIDSWDNVTPDSSADFEAHIHNYDNPHRVSAAQVGAYTVTQVNNKINQYGLLMRANGTNTLQFYRPTLGE